MELKNYQRRVISDLENYLKLLSETDSMSEAFAAFWWDRQVQVGVAGIPAYQDIIPGVPNVCYKVPTGGGKTILGCASVKPIFEAMPETKHRAVVWLVPSDAILTQTLSALRNPSHPYRQQLNTDFANRVEVYSKEELLAGQNFNPTTVTEQLTVMVLSYDSFRTRNAEGRKAYQQNGALASFPRFLGAPERPIDEADETALIQVINQLNPVVIVDESHHARSKLSLEMLEKFNPSFVLDLTATPKKESNIIAYVDAMELKVANMVKLPVIVYNRSNQAEVISDAIDLRNSLERAAIEEQKFGGDYIRPIVLFQAEPKVTEDATSFKKLRAKLVDAGIPVEQIAIKTASIDEIKGINLLSSDCPIRYIITVNALKEGWDCPFAYVLASIANKTSSVDVEQIVGRILRQPYVRKHSSKLLNMSYVLASSVFFQGTVDNVVKGLNAAGFTARDHRVIEDSDETLPEGTSTPQSEDGGSSNLFAQEGGQEGGPEPEVHGEGLESGSSSTSLDKESEDFLDFNPEDVHPTTGSAGETTVHPSQLQSSSMLAQAEQAGDEYDQKAQQKTQNGQQSTLPADLEDKVDHYKLVAKYEDDARSVRLPQFYMRSLGLFDDEAEDATWIRVSRESLEEGFSLQGKDSTIDLTHAAEEMMRIDVSDEAQDRPKAFGMNSRQRQFLRQYLDSLPEEGRINQCREIITARLDRFNGISSSDIRRYVQAVVSNLDSAQLKTLESSPQAVAGKIQDKVLAFLQEYRFSQFRDRLDTADITLRDSFSFPEEITPPEALPQLGKSLYQAEGRMNGFERTVITQAAALENVVWWHRNLENHGFFINGPINHYPDFILRTSSGRVIVVETKGEQLKNDDSRQKIELGKTWAAKAGDNFRYYMVFADNVTPMDDSLTLTGFLNQLQRL